MGSILEARKAGKAQATIAVSRRAAYHGCEHDWIEWAGSVKDGRMNLAAVAPPARPMSKSEQDRGKAVEQDQAQHLALFARPAQRGCRFP